MSYTIGEVAHAFGMSKNALRYYEEKGILSPAVDPESGYRYYDDASMHRMGSIKKLRNLGFSIEEIQDFFEDASSRRIVQTLTNCIAREEREIRLHEYRMEELRRLQSLIEHSESYGVVHKRLSPAHYELNLSSIQNLVQSRPLQKIAPEWFDNVFPVSNVQYLPADAFSRADIQPRNLLSVDETGAKLLSLPCESDFVRFVPAQDALCLFSPISFEPGKTEVSRFRAPCMCLLEYARAKNLSPVDGFYIAVIFVCSSENKGHVRYVEITMPVADS